MRLIYRNIKKLLIESDISKHEFGLGFNFLWLRGSDYGEEKSWYFNLEMHFLFLSFEITYDGE